MTPTSKRFKVCAVIKYHVDVGTFGASSEEEAKTAAEQCARFAKISYSVPGGIYDLVAEEIT